MFEWVIVRAGARFLLLYTIKLKFKLLYKIRRINYLGMLLFAGSAKYRSIVIGIPYLKCNAGADSYWLMELYLGIPKLEYVCIA